MQQEKFRISIVDNMLDASFCVSIADKMQKSVFPKLSHFTNVAYCLTSVKHLFIVYWCVFLFVCLTTSELRFQS